MDVELMMILQNTQTGDAIFHIIQYCPIPKSKL